MVKYFKERKFLFLITIKYLVFTFYIDKSIYYYLDVAPGFHVLTGG